MDEISQNDELQPSSGAIENFLPTTNEEEMQNLMKELEKIYRIINREVNGAPHEAFLVVDATTGQNGLNQAKVFNEVAKVTGCILTKLDGSSKGGIVMSISHALSIPVKLYGFGEKQEDFDRFDIDSYLYSIFKGILFEDDLEEN